MPTMTTKKRNPNDATFRNINALKKRCTVLERRLKLLETRIFGRAELTSSAIRVVFPKTKKR